MSQGSSNPTSPSRPVTASEQQETLTPVSHVFGLSEVSASLEALNIEVKRKLTVVHRAQASYSPGASMTPWSPNARDHWRSTQASPLKLKRYALQIWLEVEVGPGYFLPPEDDSYSTDFALEVLNHAYPGCTEVYLDRGGHMLAFYGRKGSSKAGLIQDVAIEASHAVREILTWMGLTAKWRVKCISLAKAKDILAQLNFITPAYAVERGMDIMSLDRLAQEIRGPLPLIAGMGGSLVEPTGFVLMNVKVPCIQGYNEDQVTLVMDHPGMTECPVILGTSTLYRVMEVIKESEISKLAVPWSSS